MIVKVSSTAKDVFCSPDLYEAVTKAISECVLDMSDETKDPKFKRHIKIDLVFTQGDSDSVALGGQVQTVLSPTICPMMDYKNLSIDDYDAETGELNPKSEA